MKQLLFCYQDRVGGEKIAITSLLPYLAKKTKWKIRVISQQEIVQMGPFGFLRQLFTSFIFWLNTFHHADFSYIVCTHYIQGFALWLSGTKTNYIFYFHGTKSFDPKILKKRYRFSKLRSMYANMLGRGISFLERKILLNANAVVFTSEKSLKECLYRYTNLQKEKLFIVPNGINPELFSPVSLSQKVKLQKKLEIKKSTKVISYVGRIEESKGIDLLIKAFQMIKSDKNHSETRLHIVHPKIEETKNSYLEKILLIIDKQNIKNVHFFQSSHEKLSMFYQISDLVVLLSDKEESPLVLLESLSCGIPFLGTDQGNMRTVLSEIDFRLLVKKKEVTAISKQLHQLLNLSPTELHQFRKKAINLMKNNSWENSAVAFQKVIQSLETNPQ